MKKIILILLLLCFFPFTALAVNYNNDANCMGSWPMESGGVETDLSGEGEDLTETDSDDLPVSEDRQFGDYSRVWGDNQTESLYADDGGSTDISGADQKFSAVAWVKHFYTSTSGNLAIVSHYGASGNRGYLLHADDQSSERFECWISDNGTNVKQAGSEVDVVTQAWNHVAAVYDDVEIQTYVGGSASGSAVAHTTGINNSSDKFLVGSRNNNGNDWWEGYIDDVGVFDRDLSSVEVSDIETNGMAGSAVEERRVIMISQGFIPLIDFETDLWVWGYERL